MPTISNKELMAVAGAIEVLAQKRYTDSLLSIKIARIRRLLAEQRDLVGPEEEQLALDYAERGPDGTVKRGENGIPLIDPARHAEWKERHDGLLAGSLEIPYQLSLVELTSGRERAENGKITQYETEPWVYDALGPLLDWGEKATDDDVEE